MLTALLLVLLSSAQERIATAGPPPEIRGHIDAFTGAFNSGSADRWEAMAAEHFAPEFLAARGPDERRRLYDNLRGDLGTIAVERVTRRGPDAPLQLHVKGSTGVTGTIELHLEPSSPYRIAGIGIEIGGGDEHDEDVPAPPISAAMSSEELSRALDAYLARLAADDTFSGVALVAKNGVPVLEKAYGFADRANRIPNTPTTRFNLGSINKMFTQTAIEQLIARGNLARTQTLGSVLPDHPQEMTRAATIDQLLGHTAGIADFFGEEFSRTAKDRFRRNADYYRLVSGQPPLFAPGTRNQYCNGCYITLGEIIEKISGMPYEQYIQENVYKPAGMTGAGPLQTDGINADVALGYTRRTPEGQLRSNVYMHGAAGSAAGGGFARAADLLAFDTAMKQGKLLDRARAMEYYGSRGIAGGAPGINALLNSGPTWTVIVLTNLDPPTGERIGTAIARALER